MRLSFAFDKRLRDKWLTVTDKAQSILAAKQITSEEPGTILKDVAMMIDFVQSEKVVSQGKNGTFPMALLPDLNRRSSTPIELVLKRPLLRDYPNLAGVFILLRVIELLQVNNRRLGADPAVLRNWLTLNPTEQYFTLLEALCFEAESSVLGGSAPREKSQALQPTLLLLAQLDLSGKWRRFHRFDATSRFGPQGELPPWNLFLLQQFGLIELQRRVVPKDEPRPQGGFGWIVERARLTAWGMAVSWNLIQFRKALLCDTSTFEDCELWDEGAEAQLELTEVAPADSSTTATEPASSPPEAATFDDADSNDDVDPSDWRPSFGTLQPAFQPYFPEWERTYARPQAELKLETHIYKVTLTGRHGAGGVGPIWRRLAVPTNISLDGLAGAILDAFGLVEDHMYEFRFRDRRGQARVYYHPYSDEGPFTPEILVGETELAVKGVMRFLFDYGDTWEFNVQLEALKPLSGDQDPEVIESVGKAPEQYPSAEW